MKMKRLILICCIFFGIAGSAWALKSPSIDVLFRGRPSGGELVEDYTGVLVDAHEYVDGYLKMIREQYGIEAMVVSIPNTGKTRSIQEAAVEMMENWKVGAKYSGRGLILLLVDDTKQVKIEVARELEDVFTDAFTGYIEDKQLKNYYLAGDLGTGLIAVMEELEKRARIKSQHRFDERTIRRLDNEFISQGAGAWRGLIDYKAREISEVGKKYPAGVTPDEAWQTIIRSYKNKVGDPNLGVYTCITRLAYKDYTNFSDSHYNEEYKKYKDKPYEIIKKGDYAVVFFGNKKGWDNSPFLLAKTNDGWQFDIVHQRKYIRMGTNPHWMMERASYPYAWHLYKCPWSMGQDIPLENEDVYLVREDIRLAQQLKLSEKAYKHHQNDLDMLIGYGQLLTKTAFNRKAIKVWKQVKKNDSDNVFAHKYLSISYVDAYYQYKQAIQEMEQYVKQMPEDVFGRNYLGYLYLHEGEYDIAIKHLEKALLFRDDNVYALCKLSRAYAGKYLEKKILDVFGNDYKKKALAYYQAAQNVKTQNSMRIWWLKLRLQDGGLLK